MAISIRERPLRNLLILALIPLVILDWVLVSIFLFSLNLDIWRLFPSGQNFIAWFILVGALLAICILELMAIFHYRMDRGK